MAGIYRWLFKPKNLWYILRRKSKGLHLFTPDSIFDVMHTNTIEMLNRDVPPLGRENDILLSIREIDSIAVLKVDQKKMTWSWGPGQLSRQHRPTLLDNGHVMVFDNGYEKGYSRILEFDPKTKEIKWNYNSKNTRNFFSSKTGMVQRLPNGNTLITETNGGRVFEVNEDGETVWEYYTYVDLESKQRQTIYNVRRSTPQDNLPVLEQFADFDEKPGGY